MHRLSKRIRTLATLALLGALFLGLILILNQMSTLIPPPAPPGDQSYPPPANPIAERVQPEYPPPNYELTAQAPSAEEIATYQSTVNATPEHEPTSWPTHTPYPTPSVCPEIHISSTVPTQPAADASGSIVFVALDESTKTDDTPRAEVYSISMDELGMRANPAESLDEIQTPYIPALDHFYYSPDGSLVMIVSRAGFRGATPLDLSAGKEQTVYVDATDGDFYNWYSDGRQALIGFGNAILAMVPLSNEMFGAPFTSLTGFGYGLIRGAAASPDGQNIVFSYAGLNDYGVWMVRANGCDLHRVDDNDLMFAEDFAWSPDGSQIAFWGNGLMIMNADGTGIRTLSKSELTPAYSFPPVWSPDSRSLAVIRSDGFLDYKDLFGPGVFEGVNIFVVDVQTGEEQPLLQDGSVGNMDPAWSPDGRMIVFVSNRSGSSELWIVNKDGTNLRQLTSAGRPVRFPFWRRK